MDRIDAINWIEQWADRHELQLQPLRRLRAGERYIGYPRQLVSDQLVSFEAFAELQAMGAQLVFEEMGPPPASSGTLQGGAAGGVFSEDDESSPPTNRGDRVTDEVFKGFQVNPGLFVGVDQLTVVGQGDLDRDAMLKMLRGYLGEGQPGLYGHNTYKSSWVFECGAELNYSIGRLDWCLVVRGRTLQLVGEAEHVKFLLDIDRYAHHCTRVDCRLDDYSRKMIDLHEVREALEAANYVGPRKSQIIEDQRISGGKLRREGASYVFGTRDSTRTIFYDKGLESKGRICANRCEVGYYKEKAAAAWVKLIEAARSGLGAFTRSAGQLVCGAVDFRARGEHRHLDRMPRLSWWAAVVDLLGSFRLKVERAISTLNSSCGSLIRQYGKKLARAAAVAEAMGHDLVLQLAEAVQSLREGQEIMDRDVSPLEAQFRPLYAFVT